MLEMLGLKSLQIAAADCIDPVVVSDKNITNRKIKKAEAPVGSENTEMSVIRLPLDKITANPDQPRKNYDEGELNELADSIREYGVLQPILVRDSGGENYIIIAGERRYRAGQLAGLKEIPAIIHQMEDQQAALIALVENVQRADLNYIEEARAYRRLMEDFNLTQNEIAKRVGKQQSTISNKIRILALPDDVQEILMMHNLTERHARALLRISAENDRRKIINKIVKNNLNVKQTEKLIEEFLLGLEEQRRKRNKINYISYKIYVNTIRKSFAQIKEMEESAVFTQEDKGDVMELKIIIPKKERCFT